MTNKQKAKNKAEFDYLYAEQLADKQGLIDANKWACVCGYLEEKLANAYQRIEELGEPA